MPVDHVAILSTLSLQQALAVAGLVKREPDRLAVRDALLAGLRDLLPSKGTPHADAARLHRELTEPGEGAHAELLRAVCRLSRGGKPPAPNRIERLLARMA